MSSATGVIAPPANFKSSVSITHIGTATAIIDIDGVNLLTDPVFSPKGTEFDMGIVVLRANLTPALTIKDLPPIDAVLLSHEDHPDNLDDLGRQVLYGRRVFTTNDGANKIGHRSGVRGLSPWETAPLDVGGRHFDITGTPCQHLPGGEVTGFVITAPEFGETAASGSGEKSRPNAIWFSGDTVYMEELREIRERFNVVVAMVNIGAVRIGGGGGDDEPLQITMDGKQAARLLRELDADVLVPMHFEGWEHFTEDAEALAAVFEDEGVADKVCWLKPMGEPKRII